MSYNFEQLDLKILKHFEKINKNIYIEKDTKEWRTIATAKTIVAKYRTDNPIPFTFSVRDLNEFLNNYYIFTEPKLTRKDDLVYIRQGQDELTYHMSDKSNLVFPTKEYELPETNFEFELTADDLLFIERFGKTLNVPDIVLYSNKGEVYLRISDKKIKKDTGNSINRKLNIKTNKQFIYFFKVDVWTKLFKSNYKFKIKERIVELSNNFVDLTYYFASEFDSVADELPKHKYPIKLDQYWN